MIKVILLFIVMISCISWYSSRLIKRILNILDISYDKKYIKIITALLSLVVGIFGVNIFGFSAVIILHFITLCLIADGVNLIVNKIKKATTSKGYKAWKYLHTFCVFPLIITVGIMTYGYLNLNTIRETSYTVYTHKDIRDEGYRVCLIADVHYGVSLDKAELTKVCNQISTKDVDMVILCGDITDDNTSKEGMEEVFQVLGNIKSEFGTFYVYGNHDLQRYSPASKYTMEQHQETLKKNNITILCDSMQKISPDFTLVGRDDASLGGIPGKTATPERKDISELLSGANKDTFILTADHQPKEYAKNGYWGTDLLISGHTHGGQIWPANILDTIFKFNEASYGMIHIDSDTDAIVTSGLAGWNYPIKTAAPAEYVIIDIKPKR